MTGRTQDGDTITVMAPKDTEGREIPLDTKRLYDAYGLPVSIRAFRYNPNECFWRVERLDGLGTPKTTELRLTASDSWEKLEEDLSRAAKHDAVPASCRYFTSGRCADCRMHDGFTCGTRKTERAFADVIERIHNLRGDK